MPDSANRTTSTQRQVRARTLELIQHLSVEIALKTPNLDDKLPLKIAKASTIALGLQLSLLLAADGEELFEPVGELMPSVIERLEELGFWFLPIDTVRAELTFIPKEKSSNGQNSILCRIYFMGACRYCAAMAFLLHSNNEDNEDPELMFQGEILTTDRGEIEKIIGDWPSS